MSETVRILVVEDDRSISMGLRMNLQAEGYEVDVAADGTHGLELMKRGYDLMVLDLMLPGLNGFEVLEQLRARGDRTPVIVLTARTEEEDVVAGLEIGADDYVTKPFGVSELLARIRTQLRRRGREEPRRWNFGEIEVDGVGRRVRRSGDPVELTATEFDVLVILLLAGGRVLSRDEIFQKVWGPNHHGTRRTVDNFVAQLRAKLEVDPASPLHLLTVRGRGYRLERNPGGSA